MLNPVDIEIDVDISYLPWQTEVFFERTEKYIIVPKGRRPGATRGAMHASSDWMLDKITPILWVETINVNIEKYFELFMRPILKQIKGEYWDWNVQKKILQLFDSTMFFGSAEAPESLEGFGYKKIILNEAGIILKNDYLYNNAVLPMMIDHSDSQLYALGVPKGIHKKDGNQHMFSILAERAGDTGGKYGDPTKAKPNYWMRRVTAYDNPTLLPSDIDELHDEIRTPVQRAQEIDGLFVDGGGDNPFAEAYSPDMHESESVIQQANKQLFIFIDFNLNPFAVVFANIWRDAHGMHFHTFADHEIARGSIPAMIKYIDDTYRASLHACVITGDPGGKKGDLSQTDQASHFEQLRRGLGLRTSQIIVPAAPFHTISRDDCNYILHWSTKTNSGIDIKVNPLTAKGTARDLKNVQWDSIKNQIVKRDRKDINQRADYLDGWRYGVNTFLKRFIISHMKQTKQRKTNN